MPLVEVIVKETSDKTLAAAIDYVIAIRKFNNSERWSRVLHIRVFGKYINEGITMLTEGYRRSY
jgi:3-hydroxyacyl-CoA dehydrogenase/enoyl-CoA hydratase/3-hydroxybutyryl-CoA epimerase